MTAAYKGLPRRRPVPLPATDDGVDTGLIRLMERRAAVVLAEAPTTDDAMLRLLARREALPPWTSTSGDELTTFSAEPSSPTDAVELPAPPDPTVARLLARRAGPDVTAASSTGATDVDRLLARREGPAQPVSSDSDDDLVRLLSRRAFADTTSDTADAAKVERLLVRRSTVDRPVAEPENADPALARLLARRADTEE